jgi:CxxC motif-containing protein (DUF1111 family)
LILKNLFYLKIFNLKNRVFWFYCIVVLAMVACKNDVNEEMAKGLDFLDQYEQGEEYTAGENATVFDNSINAYNNSIPGLSGVDLTNFIIGNSFNRNNWVIAPASTTARDGLGPVYNSLSCSGCHTLDGRGKPPEFGEPTESMVYRLSIEGFNEHNEPLGVPNYGDQLNHRAIPEVEPEGDVDIVYTEITGSYPDGTTYSLRKPTYTFQNPELNGVLFSPRVAPKMAGTGIFDAFSEASILANADPDDENQDGISGKPNYVWDYYANDYRIGRIGWKASQPSVKQQIAHAILNDIGITSSIFPEQNLWGNQIVSYANLPNGGTPEIPDSTLYKIYYYTSALAMPARRNYLDQTVLEGKKIFKEVGCIKCHVATMTTDIHPDVPQLSNQKVHIYSDLLLHDMGSLLADNRPDGQATGSEWRTAALWGIGVQEIVNGHTFLLNDGRARNIEEAILWHGGEASGAKNNFKNLPKEKREKLITFINSL